MTKHKTEDYKISAVKYYLIVSLYNYDECETVMNSIHVLTLLGLYDLRRYVNCDDNTFNKYVSVYIPRYKTKIVVHSKVYLFDDNHMLYSTANICDRSFYKKGDIEIGFITNNTYDVCKIQSQLLKNIHDTKHLFRKFKFNKICIEDIQMCIAEYIRYCILNCICVELLHKPIMEINGNMLNI